MSKFYGMIQGNRGAVTRGGSASSGFKATAQSWKGSLIVNMDEDTEGNTTVLVETSEYSRTYGDVKFRGTLKEFNEMCDLYKQIKNGELTAVRRRKKTK